MLATRPSKNAAEYRPLLTEESDAGEGIFSGLTFPEVPTDQPKIQNSYSVDNSRNEDYVELASSDADSDVPIHRLRVPLSFKWQRSTKPLPIATEVNSDEMTNDSAKQKDVTVPATSSQRQPDYSSLYYDFQTNESVISNSEQQISQYPSISERECSQVSKQEEEKSDTPEQTKISDLIQDIQLLRQNLSNQLEPQLSTVSVCQVNGRGSASQRQWLSSQEIRQISPRMTQVHQEMLRQLHMYEDELESLLTKNKIDVKYICCGSCRKWMKADAAASLVRCPNSACLAVNNLMLAPLNAATTTTQQQPQESVSSPVNSAQQQQTLQQTQQRQQPKVESGGIFSWMCLSCYEENEYEL